MNKTKEALNLALEALEDAKKNHGLVYVTELCAIREALAEQPAQQQCPHDFLMGDDEPGHDSVCMQCGAAVPNDEPAQQQEIDELTAQRDKLADILTRTANALKGQPAELSVHSWHDLPEVAQQLKAAQQQEPYGWKVYGVNSLFMGEFAEDDAKAEAKRIGGTCIAFPLYTSPPASKPWVGLTDEQIAEIASTPCAVAGSYVHTFARAIEAKLREKNA